MSSDRVVMPADAADPAPSPSPIAVRAATEGDCDQIADNLRIINEFEQRDMSLPQLSAADLARDGFGPRPAFSCLVADDAGAVVGHAIFTRGWLGYDGIGKCLYLADLFVQEAYRKRGVGRRLVEAVAAAGVRDGAPHIEFTVYGWNEAALRFYKRLGCRSATDECELTSFYCEKEAVTKMAKRHEQEQDGGEERH